MVVVNHVCDKQGRQARVTSLYTTVLPPSRQILSTLPSLPHKEGEYELV
jgi:hypothetical protein